MVVYSGGKASGFKNVRDHDTYDQDGTRLFRVRGTCAEDVRVVQIQPEAASSLNSEDVFILETPSQTWIWNGEASSEEEVAHAQSVVAEISPDRDPQSIAEGSEPDEFWDALGGKSGYARVAKDLNKPILEPRLFRCKTSEASGKLRAFEVVNFDQSDLGPDDVMMLDSGAEIYVWIGKEAAEDDTKKSLELAKVDIYP